MSPRPRSRPGREGKLREGGQAIGPSNRSGVRVLIARCSNASLHPHPRPSRVLPQLCKGLQRGRTKKSSHLFCRVFRTNVA